MAEAQDNTRTQQPEVAGGTRTFGTPDGTGTFDTPAAPGEAQSLPAVPGYDVVEPVGHGGMGRVFKARQLATNRVVAIKLILAGEFAGAIARARFKAEIEITATLSHPHIVQLYEAGEASGRAFLVCEFMAGGSLAARLDGTPWEAKRAARLLVPLARAVAHAHTVQIVHRDLKPSNVLLTADGTPKVADFGIAKRLDADFTNTGAVMGTPSYMPPEQAGGAKLVGPPADVYALGAILYELLTGRPPFKGADFVETIDLVRTQEPVPPRVLQPRLPRDVETICLKCLQKDPTKRYTSAESLADDLERFLEGRPIVARPVGALERAWRWTRRNPAVASLLAAVLLVFAAGAGVASYFAVQADERAQQANASADEARRREKEADDERRRTEEERNKLRAEQDRTEQLLYATQIFQAHTSAVEYRTGRLNQLLADTRPRPGRPDIRGWEWHYLRRLARSWDSEQKLDLTAPGFPKYDPSRGGSLNASLTADGKRVIVSMLGTNVSATMRGGLFDAATGRFLRPFPQPEAAPGTEPNWYPEFCPEGKFAAAREEYTRQQPLPPGVFGPPRHFTRYRVRLVNLETDKEEARWSEFEVPPRPRIARSGNRVVILLSPWPPTAELTNPADYPCFEVWDRGQPKLVRRVIRSGTDKKPVPVSVVSPDGAIAAVTYTEVDGKVRSEPFGGGNRLEFWNIAGDPARIGETHIANDQINGTAFSLSGRWLAATEGDRAVGVYDTRTGRCAGRWEFPRDVADALAAWNLSVSDDGLRVALTGFNGLVVLGERVGDKLPGSTNAPQPPKPQADTVGNWRTTILRGPPPGGAQLLPNVWLAPDGGRLVLLSSDKFQSWNLPPAPGFTITWPERLTLGKNVTTPNPNQKASWVLYASLSGGPYGGEPGTGQTHRLGLYDAVGRKMVREFDVVSDFGAYGQFSPDGKRLLLVLLNKNPAGSAPGSESLQRFSLRSMDDPTRELPCDVSRVSHTAFGVGVFFSEDNRWIIQSPPSNGADPSVNVKVWRAADGNLSTEIKPEHGTVHAGDSWGPDGRLVLVSHPEVKPPAPGKQPDPVAVTLRCHDPETGKVLWAWAPPDAFPVQMVPAGFTGNLLRPAVQGPACLYSPDGRKLAVTRVSDDGSAKVWVLDMATGALERELTAPAAETGRPVPGNFFVLGGLIGQGKGAFGPGGRLAIWVNRDVVVWDGQSPEPLHRLSGHEAQGLSALFTNDGSRLFTLDSNSAGGGLGGPGERTLRVWELTNGRELITVRLTGETSGTGNSDLWANDLRLDGEKLLLRMPTGVRVFDGTPLKDGPPDAK